MGRRTVTVQLMGGLGNQMFQYAAGRSLALRNGFELVLDVENGFTNDRIFQRTFELGRFGIQGKRSGTSAKWAYRAERVWNRIFPSKELIRNRPWGTQVTETKLDFEPQVPSLKVKGNVYLRGYWQSERYFEDYVREIRSELAPPEPHLQHFREKAEEIRDCNAIGVGVRLFEEIPSTAVGQFASVTPVEFYSKAAQVIPTGQAPPVFFVFCTKRFPVLETIPFPGETRFVTHDDGFEGAVDRMWLMSQCRHFIVSHSSFYWWAAWLAESRSDTTVVASEAFPGKDSIPSRWMRIGL